MACQTRILWNQVLSSSSACAAGPPYGWKPVCRGRRRWDGRGCATGSSKPESLITWAAITLMTRRITRRTFRCTGQQTSREHERARSSWPGRRAGTSPRRTLTPSPGRPDGDPGRVDCHDSPSLPSQLTQRAHRLPWTVRSARARGRRPRPRYRFDASSARRAAASVGYEPVFVPMPWARRLSAVSAMVSSMGRARHPRSFSAWRSWR